MAGLDVFPEALVLEILARGDGVERPLALGCSGEELDGADEHGASRRAEVVFVPAEPENDWAAAK